jgi:hypothetical protein
LENNYIYASTCDRINENLLLCVGGFDLCIVLDADLVEEPIVMGPLMLSKRFVMVGDYLSRMPSLKSKLA